MSPGAERLAEGAAHRLLAEMLHVEGGLALALRHLHARVEGPQRHHVAQAFEQLLVGEQPGPWPDRLALAVEHADDREGEIADVARVDVDRRAAAPSRPRRSARWRNRACRPAAPPAPAHAGSSAGFGPT